MGASESTIETVEDLSVTLQQLQERLSVVESLTYHQTVQNAKDDFVIVNGVNLNALSDISLAVGPILGFTTPTTARVLLEISSKNPLYQQSLIQLTISVFRIDHVTSIPQFIRNIPIDLPTNEPRAITLESLEPNSLYSVYIGGINAKDLFNKYLYFRTLPTDAQYLHIACIHAPRLDSVSPGEIPLLDELAKRVPHHRAAPVLASATTPPAQEIHLALFLGNTLSIDATVEKTLFNLIGSVCDSALSDEAWTWLLATLERDLFSHYRRVLNDKDVSTILRRCSCIFLHDTEEMGAASILNATFPCDLAEDPQPEQRALKTVVVQLLSKTARHVHMLFLRQLWDSSCLDVVAANRREMDVLVEEIKLRRRLLATSQATDRLTALLSATTNREGAESASAARLQGKLTEAMSSREEAEARITTFMLEKPVFAVVDGPLATGLYSRNSALLTASALKTTETIEFQRHGVLRIGSTVLILIERGWESAASDADDLELMYAVEPNLDLFLNTADPAQGALVGGTPVNAVLVCVSGSFAPDSTAYTTGVSSKLLIKLARWKQEETHRKVTVLLTSASNLTATACSGIVTPSIVSAEYSDADIERLAALPYRERPVEWIEGRSEMSLLCLNEMNGPARLLPSASAHVEDVTSDEESVKASSLFQFKIDLASASMRKSFWLVRAIDSCTLHTDLTSRDVAVTIGPVLGRLTPFAATIMMEVTSSTAHQVHVEVELCDVLTGMRINAVQLVRCGKPLTFEIVDLRPNRFYNVGIYQRDDGVLTLSLAKGSFTTPPLFYFNSPVEELANMEGVLQQLRGSSSVNDSSTTVDAFNILMVGANLQSAARSKYREDCVGDDAHLAKGQELIEVIDAVLSEPWSSIDMVIHFGPSVDLTLVIDDIVKFLCQAEATLSEVERSSYLLDAEEAYRDAYRSSWSVNAGYKSILASGQHLFISSPMFEILEAFQSKSLNDVARDYMSDYSLQHLLAIGTKLHLEYCSQLHPPGTVLQQKCLYEFCQGRVIGFQLQPKVLMKQHSHDASSNLIGVEALAALGNIFSAHTDMEHLLLLSTLPLFRGDLVASEYGADPHQGGLRYTLQDLKAILRLISDWLLADARRQCTILTASMDISFSASVEITKPGVTGPALIRQYSCNPIIAGLPKAFTSTSYQYSNEQHSLTFDGLHCTYTYQVDQNCVASNPTVCLVKIQYTAENSLAAECNYLASEELRDLQLNLRVPSDVEQMLSTVLHNVLVGTDENADYKEKEVLVGLSIDTRELLATKAIQLDAAYVAFKADTADLYAAISKCLELIIASEPVGTLLRPSSFVIKAALRNSARDLVGMELQAESAGVLKAVLISDQVLFVSVVRQILEAALLLSKLAFNAGYSS